MADTTQISALIKTVEQAQTALIDLDDTQKQQHPRQFADLLETLAYAELALQRTAPELIPDQTVSRLSDVIGGVAGNPAFSASVPWESHFAVVEHLRVLPNLNGREFEQDVAKDARRFRQSAQSHLTAFRREVDSLRRELGSDREALQSTQSGFETRIQQLSTEAQDRLDELANSVSSTSERIDQALREQASRFDEGESRRQDEADTRLAELREETMLDTARVVGELEVMRDQAQGLVGALSAATTANHYRDDASRERSAYWVLLLGTLCALAMAFKYAEDAAALREPDLATVVAKFGVTLTLLALAGYAGTRAGDHRQRAKDSKTKEMQLRAFGPFTAPLPPQEKVRERIIMTRRFFTLGTNSGGDDLTSSEVLTTDPALIAEAIRSSEQLITQGDQAPQSTIARLSGWMKGRR